MRLTHNIPSLNIYTKYKSALASQSTSMARISSGKRINQTSDDPYGKAQDTNFTMQLRGLQMANQNAQDGVSLAQVAEGGLDGINSMLQRIRDLAVQASNGTENTSDKNAIQLEVSNLVQNINTTAKSTNMNGINILNDSSGQGLTAMIGANVGEQITIPTFNFTTDNSSGALYSLSTADVTTSDNCKTLMDNVDSAMSQINSALSKYGAVENRFTSTADNIGAVSNEVEAGDSDAVDTDIAAEMLNYSRSSIVVQAGIAMMAQTNKFPQDVLSILQNIRAN
jgi:flagellin